MSAKGEKYKSMAAKKKHEMAEGKKEMMMEYGKTKKKPGVKKPSVKKGK
jgi:hypothetical protein